MKTKLLIFILLFTVQIVESQSFDKKSNWSIITTNLFDYIPDKITTYKVEGDTLVDNKTYLKIFENNVFFAALRETEDNKIYVHFPDWDGWGYNELLVYDFGWHPNDTLYHETLYCDDKAIHAILKNEIDSIQLLDRKQYPYAKSYRGLTYDCFPYVGDTIIRGIGDTRGFFYSTFDLPTDGSQYALLCFHIDDVLVYSHPNYSYCTGNSIDIVTNNDSKIKIHPNSSDHSITVEFLENLIVNTFQIFDIKGALIKTYKVGGKSKIEVQNLVKGTYVYTAIVQNNQKLSGKILIQ